MPPSRILVVEDENIVALDIEMRLIGLGYQVVGTADTGQRAIRLAMEEQPDLILMDINLRGEIDGIETARQIEAQKKIPIVFLTAYADDSTFGKAVKMEPFGYILKPFDEKELHMTIEIALYRHKTEEKLRTAAAENKRLHQEVQRYANELEKRVDMRTAEFIRTNDRMQLILNTVRDAIVFLDVDGSVVYMNPAAEKSAGYNAEQASTTDMHWRESMPDAVYDQIEQAFIKGEAWEGDVINCRYDGVLYDAAVQFLPIVDAEGDNQGFLYVQHDTSQLKELERLKAQFVSRIGHELRTPLANIHLYLDLLERGSIANQHRYITVLRHELKRLDKLIIGFLEISGLNAQNNTLELEPLEIAPLIIGAVAKYKNQLAHRFLSVDYLFASNAQFVMGDKHSLDRILSHLIDNTSLYAPQNSRVVIETAVKTRQNTDWVTISIQQAGEPISRDEQSALFDRFYRGVAAKNGGIPGAGLGLAFCKESLEKQAGFITVTSNPDVGNTFTIWLAIADI